jgi:hypothetical protein
MEKIDLVLHVDYEVRDKIIKIIEDYPNSLIGKLIIEAFKGGVNLFKNTEKNVFIKLTDIKWEEWESDFESELMDYMYGCMKGEMFIIYENLEVKNYGCHYKSDIKFKLKMIVMVE